MLIKEGFKNKTQITKIETGTRYRFVHMGIGYISDFKHGEGSLQEFVDEHYPMYVRKIDETSCPLCRKVCMNREAARYCCQF